MARSKLDKMKLYFEYDVDLKQAKSKTKASVTSLTGMKRIRAEIRIIGARI